MQLFILALLLFTTLPILAERPAADEQPRILHSVEGRIHQQQMQLTLDRESPYSGWVKMRQCHREMAPTGRSSVVFRQGVIRNLKILGATGIGAYSVGKGGTSIEMEDIAVGNEICMEGLLKTLRKIEDRFQLESGPYFLRFLDGYFPLKLELVVDSSQSGMKVVAVEPQWVPYEMEEKKARIDLLFEGRLDLIFSLAPDLQ